jgi:hypothetical protein
VPYVVAAPAGLLSSLDIPKRSHVTYFNEPTEQVRVPYRTGASAGRGVNVRCKLLSPRRM